MKKVRLVFLVMLMVAGFCLSGCDLFFTQTTKTLQVSGTTTFNGSMLEGVEIKTSTQTLCKSDANGNFSFTINSNQIEVFAEKQGYVFSPRSVIITDSTENLSFIAKQIEPLNGEIVLSSVNITPTSIATLPDNFKYSTSSGNCLKIKKLLVKIDNFEYENFVSNKSMAIKNNTNTYNVGDQEYSIKTQNKFSIKFSLSAYFSAYGSDHEFNETRLTTINVASNKTTAHLNDNNQFEVSLFGINSSNNMFSYNITFIFDYYPTIL